MMNPKNQQKQILFDVPIGMYDAINVFVKSNGMTKKGLMHKLINSFMNNCQKDIESCHCTFGHIGQKQ